MKALIGTFITDKHFYLYLVYMDVHRCHNWRSLAINPALVASVGPSLVIT